MIEITGFKGKDNPDLLNDIVKLRLEIWKGQGIDLKKIGHVLDRVDDDAYHIVCFQDHRLVAAGRVSLHQTGQSMPDFNNFSPWITEDDFPAAFLNRLIVHRQFRGQGIAKEIDKARLKFVADNAINKVFVEATGSRVKWLKTIGFKILGESQDRRYPGTWFIMRRHFLS